MNKKTALLLAFAVAAFGQQAAAKEIKIQENSAGLSAELTENLAGTAVSMGVKEPLVIKKSGDGVVISGAGATRCNIKLNDDKIAGVSCK
jgi:putative periplasmic protein